MLVGDILVKMSADMADLRSGFEQMRDQADKFGKGVGQAVDFAKGALAALGVAASAGMFAHAIKEAIEYADNLNDLSKKTGIAVETLGGLGYAAGQSGTTLEAVSAAGIKLAKNMAEAAGGNDKASAAFKALGISVTDAQGNLRGIDETMFDLADKFAMMEDGPGKAALAMQYFGKSGADLIPMLNEGGDKLRALVEEYKKYGGVTTATAQAADQFNDTLSKLNLMSGAFTKELTAALLPVFQAVANIFLEAKQKGEGFGGAITYIVSGFKILVSAAMYAVEIVLDFGKGLGALAAAAVAIANGDFRGAVEVIKGYSSDVKQSWGKTSETVSTVWNASISTMVDTSNAGGPKISAPLVKAASDVTDEFKKMLAEMELIKAADAAGLATGTVKQLTDLMNLLDAGKIKWDDYNTVLGLILDKDPKLKAEQEALNKALADAQKEIDKVKDSWDKETQSLNDRIQKQVDANAAFGLGKAALIDLQVAHIDERIALEEASGGYSAYVAHLEEVRGKLIELRNAVAIGEGLEAQKKDLEKAQKNWDAMIQNVSAAFSTFINDWVNNGASAAFKNLWNNFKNWALSALAEIAAKQIVVSITGALGTTGAGAGGLIPGGSGGGGIFDSLLSAGTSLASSFGSVAFAAADFAQLVGQGVGVMEAFSMSTAAAGVGLAQIVPVVGAVVAAGYAIYSFLESKKGGPKEGGFGSTGDTPGITGVDSNGRWMTPSGSDADMVKAVKSMDATFQNLVKLLGGSGSAVFAQGFSTDPKGSAPSNVHTGTWVNGVQVFDNPNGNVGRSPEELKAELEKQSMQAILAALQASELPEVVSSYLNSIDVSTATVEQIKEALAHAAELKVLVDAVSALPVEMAEGLLAALGVDPELDAKIKAFAEEFAAFSAAAGQLQDQLDRDPKAEALQALALAQATTFEKVGILKGGLEDALAAYDGSTEGTKNLTDATKAYIDAQVAALVQIEQIRNSLNEMFGATQRTFELALLSAEEKQQWYVDEALKTVELLKNTTDPEKIKELSGIINNDLTSALGLIDPVEQKAEYDHLWEILNTAQTTASAQLDLAEAAIVDAGNQTTTILNEVQTALDSASEKQMEAAQALIDAAQVIKDAANAHATAASTNAAAANTNAAAANTNAAAAEANLEAANTPVNVNVTVEQASGP